LGQDRGEADGVRSARDGCDDPWAPFEHAVAGDGFEDSIEHVSFIVNRTNPGLTPLALIPSRATPAPAREGGVYVL
jgi:hypothetical protein